MSALYRHQSSVTYSSKVGSHTGKDAEKGLRGHSSLFAALDGAIAVNRTEAGRSIKIDKVKDGADGSEFAFKLEVVTVGKDEDGDEITSCVVIPAELPAKTVTLGTKLSDGENFLRTVFWEAHSERQKYNYNCDPKGVPVQLWRKVFDKKSHLENETSKKRTFYRDLGKLTTKGFFMVENDIAFPMLPQIPINGGAGGGAG